MKRNLLLLAGICFALSSLAQTDSTTKDGDTIRVGNILILKDGKSEDGHDDDIRVRRRKPYKPSKVTTNWGVVDLGISHFNDKTNYAQAISQGDLAPGANKDWFDLRERKSVNVNIWFFMQRLSLINHYVNLKYGLGLELNNYRYDENIKFQEDISPLVIMSNVDYRKNKLAADYLTVPMMLNFNFTPNRRHGFGFSVGASAGYLYASRQKTISKDDGKQKFKDDFDLRKWKVSYIGELSLGVVKLYGSYATESMFENAIDQTPYTVGIRLSN